MDEVDIAQSYRMHRLESIQEEIKLEREKQRVLINKFSKGCMVVETIQHGLVIAMIGFGATGLGTILTVVGIPISVAMDVGAVTAGILSIANSRIGKCLRAKLKKHERMRTLAETKQSAISDCISKALEDNAISQEEYSQILCEYMHYNAMKEEIRIKTKKELQEKASHK